MITTETINGEKRLVITHTKMGFIGAFSKMLFNGDIATFFDGRHTATALPPLPRHPKNDEATIRLLSLYRAHGIKVWGEWRAKDHVYGYEPLDDLIEAMKTEWEAIEIRVSHGTYNGEKIELVFGGDE